MRPSPTRLGEAARGWCANPGVRSAAWESFQSADSDAVRLRQGLDELEHRDPQRAAAVRVRVRDAIARLSPDFPGDAEAGILVEDTEAERRFEDFGNDEPCPVLDPATGMCSLYSSRPITCRSFGPPVRSEGGLGVCELCYHGASDQQIAACEMSVDPDDLEAELLEELERAGGSAGRTIIAFALAD